MAYDTENNLSCILEIIPCMYIGNITDDCQDSVVGFQSGYSYNLSFQRMIAV